MLSRPGKLIIFLPKSRELVFVELRDVVFLKLQLSITGLESFNFRAKFFDQNVDYVLIYRTHLARLLRDRDRVEIWLLFGLLGLNLLHETHLCLVKLLPKLNDFFFRFKHLSVVHGNLLSLLLNQLQGFLALDRDLELLLGHLKFKASQSILNRSKQLIKSYFELAVDQTDAILFFK